MCERIAVEGSMEATCFAYDYVSAIRTKETQQRFLAQKRKFADSLGHFKKTGQADCLAADVISRVLDQAGVDHTELVYNTVYGTYENIFGKNTPIVRISAPGCKDSHIFTAHGRWFEDDRDGKIKALTEKAAAEALKRDSIDGVIETSGIPRSEICFGIGTEPLQEDGEQMVCVAVFPRQQTASDSVVVYITGRTDNTFTPGWYLAGGKKGHRSLERLTCNQASKEINRLSVA